MSAKYRMQLSKSIRYTQGEAILVKTILNTIEKFKSFIYGKTWLEQCFKESLEPLKKIHGGDGANLVLETLNDKTVINTNSLASFQHAVEGKFWGGKFGVQRYLVSLDVAQRVIKTGDDQKNFDNSCSDQYDIRSNAY